MNIKKLRQDMNMTQRQFSSYFGIPIGTLRNWEQEIASPPEYVFNMIVASLRRDKMINVETIRFMRMLDELAELTKEGIDDFANATEENVHSKVFYDPETIDEEGRYRVVWGTCVIDEPGCEHHDVYSYYDSYVEDGTYDVKVVFDEEVNDYYVLVTFPNLYDEIVIEDGKWMFV